MLTALMSTEWVVYSKPCLARTETVVDYLGRYSHRIALADSRLRNFDGDTVDLSYKDYRDGHRRKVMTLTGEELLRRTLLHVLPKGFVRIWHFGFLANRCRAQRLPAVCDGACPPGAKSRKFWPSMTFRHACGAAQMSGLRPIAHGPLPHSLPRGPVVDAARGYNPLSIETAIPGPGTVAGSD